MCFQRKLSTFPKKVVNLLKSNLVIAKEVLEGKWGNGGERKKKLAEAGYNYDDIQGIVNALLNDTPEEPISVEPVFEIKGTEIMEVDVNLNQYKGIKLTFKVE